MLGTCMSSSTAANQDNVQEGDGVLPPADTQWVLCGQINLHKSPACAAQLVNHVNYALTSAKLRGNGNIVNMPFVPSHRTPQTVTEWRAARRATALAEGREESEDEDEEEEDDDEEVVAARVAQFQRDLDNLMAEARGRPVQSQTEQPQPQAQPPLQPQVDGSPPGAFIIAVQEPHTKKEHISNVSGAKTVFASGAKKVRAAIIVSKTLNPWPVEDYMNGDLAVALIKTEELNVYVVSLYADIKKAVIMTKLRALVNKARAEKAGILIMGDVNSHSETLWNDKKTCARGKQWEDYVLDNNLLVENMGDTFTFSTKKGQSIIDVTFSNAEVTDRVRGWEVIDAVPGSDHVMIQFALQLRCNDPVSRRNFRKCDWKLFTEKMENMQSEFEDKEVWTVEDMELEASAFTKDLDRALTNACPYTTEPVGLRKLTWWGGECKRLHTRLRSIRKYLRWHKRYHSGESRKKYTHEDLVQCRRGFKAACKKAKRKAWQSFMEGVESTPEVARLNKAFTKKVNKEIGLLQDPATGKLCDPEESIALLCDTHFPKCQSTPPDRERRPLSQTCNMDDRKAAFINPHRVKVVIKSFGPYKGPGPDGHPPVVYQNLGTSALQRLCRLYKASYLLGVMPRCWREIKVIFLAKPDKPSYFLPKAWRPISLMSFGMKILEKLLLWEFEDTCLSLQPLQTEQNGFRKGRNCDSCLTVVYQEVEHALIKKHYSVAVYLDIEGCYDNIQNVSMSQALRARGANDNYVAWYEDFFYHRHIVINTKGVHKEAYPVQGAPQGGVGSPLLWSLLADELIKRVKASVSSGSLPTYIQMYADDSVIYSSGPNAHDCVVRVQKGINAAVQWGKENLLNFSPTKTEALLFTRRRKKPVVPKLKIEGRSIDFVPVARHLGVWVDPQLRWAKHIDIKCLATKQVLYKHRAAIGGVWGYKPSIAMYVWRGIARPKLTFGCLVWSAAMRVKTRRDQLRRVQSLSFRLLAQYRARTPVIGMEIITNTLPMDLYILRTAAKSYFRTLDLVPYTDNDMHTSIKSAVGHRQWISKALADNGLEWLKDPSDAVPLYRRWERQFLVNLESMDRSNPRRGVPVVNGRYSLYTDGSKLTEDLAGAGMAVFRDGQLRSVKSWHLGNLPSVFQCELYGLKNAAKWLIQNKQEVIGEVVIFTDNQASMYAINSTFIKSQIVQETVDLLDQAVSAVRERDSSATIQVSWCRAHAGFAGNERADQCAKEGAENTALLVNDPPRMPKATLHLEMDRLAAKLWRERWVADPTCRQTKHWFPEGPVPHWSFALINQPRIVFGQLVGWLTGHNHLKRHQAIIDASVAQIMGIDSDDEDAPDKWCDLCGGGEQTTEHIMSFCDKFAELRYRVFEESYPQKPFVVDVPKLVTFLKEAKIQSLEMFQTFQDYRKHHGLLSDTGTESEHGD